MKRIKQRNFEAGDCGIACAAMVSGKSYVEAHEAAIRLGLRSLDGTYFTYHCHLEALLKKLGKRCIRKRFKSMRAVQTPAIVKVNPREDGRYWHWVVLASRNGELVILDPNPTKPTMITKFRGYKGRGFYLHVI